MHPSRASFILMPHRDPGRLRAGAGGGWWKLAALPAFVILSACGTAPPRYVQPASLTPQNAAVIIGSTTVDSAFMQPDAHTSLAAVDGAVVFAKPETSTLVTPGQHSIIIYSCWCAPFEGNRNGEVTTVADFEAGKTYTLKSDVPTGNGYWGKVNVWIEDGTDTKPAPKLTVKLYNPETPPIVALFAPK